MAQRLGNESVASLKSDMELISIGFNRFEVALAHKVMASPVFRKATEDQKKILRNRMIFEIMGRRAK